MKNYLATINCLFSIIFLLNLSSLALATASSTSVSSAAKQVQTIAEDMAQKYLQRFPEQVTYLGLHHLPHNKFTDKSLTTLANWRQQEDQWLRQLNKIKRTNLTEDAEITFSTMHEYLTASIAERVCHNELWDIGPFAWQASLAELAEKQPVGTPLSRSQALARWQQFPKYIDQEIRNLAAGARAGYSAPIALLPRIIRQLDAILTTPITKSPFFVPGERDADPKFRDQFSKLVASKINPAIKKYRDYLANDYIHKARHSFGVSELAHGKACYQAKIRRQVTLAMPAKKIHDIGLQQMQAVATEAAVIAKNIGINNNANILTKLFAYLQTAPEAHFNSEAELLAYNQAALERVQHLSSNFFQHMPKSAVIIKPYPPYRNATGAPGEYHLPAKDGSTPGIFYINTYQPTQKLKADIEATLFHETIPGHHYQLALALENTNLPPIVNYLTADNFNAGFIEGWALYAERLAAEMNLYSSDIDKIGLLGNEALRAARLVVDTGIHVMGWHPNKAADYLNQHTMLPKDMVLAEIDRYIAYPGQATAYTLGQLEITSLRSQAQQQLGEKFDIKAFHHEVLKDGSVTFGILRNKVKRWLQVSKSPATAPG